MAARTVVASAAVGGTAEGQISAEARLSPLRKARHPGAGQATDPAPERGPGRSAQAALANLAGRDGIRLPTDPGPLGTIVRDAAKMTRLETHFAPVMRALATEAEASHPKSSPAATILGQLRSALAATDAAPPNALEPTVRTPLPPQQAGAIVRVMSVALQPAALGALTVTLRLSAGGLRVSVAASERDTAEALADSREELAELITAAGYAIEDVSITDRTGRQLL